MRRRNFLLGALSAGLLAACTTNSGSPTTSASAPAESTDSPAADSSTDSEDMTAGVPSDRTAPEISVPAGDPPKELLVEDEIVGDGAEAVAGKTLAVHYTGVSWSTGEVFDSSWQRGQPFSFQLGEGQVIQGWDEGLKGMKVGGRRRITIPPEMGYGSNSAGSIKPNETLIFVCDLVSVS